MNRLHLRKLASVYGRRRLLNALPSVGQQEPTNASAIWEVQEIPGLFVATHFVVGPYTSENKWITWIMGPEDSSSQAREIAQQLDGQLFSTRAEIMQAIEAARLCL